MRLVAPSNPGDPRANPGWRPREIRGSTKTMNKQHMLRSNNAWPTLCKETPLRHDMTLERPLLGHLPKVHRVRATAWCSATASCAQLLGTQTPGTCSVADLCHWSSTCPGTRSAIAPRHATYALFLTHTHHLVSRDRAMSCTSSHTTSLTPPLLSIVLPRMSASGEPGATRAGRSASLTHPESHEGPPARRQRRWVPSGQTPSTQAARKIDQR